MRTKTFYEQKGCFEEKEKKFYCNEYDNVYCPRTCNYAIKKQSLAEKKVIAGVYSDGNLIREIFEK